jgi:hypothetical protein
MTLQRLHANSWDFMRRHGTSLIKEKNIVFNISGLQETSIEFKVL